MQHAKFKPHAEERTCRPFQRPSLKVRQVSDIEGIRPMEATTAIKTGPGTRDP
jgi:hypothetical protein